MPRKSAKQIEGESGLRNLVDLIGLIQDETDNRERGAMVSYHARNAARWVAAARAVNLALPEYVDRNAAYLRANGWGV